MTDKGRMTLLEIIALGSENCVSWCEAGEIFCECLICGARGAQRVADARESRIFPFTHESWCTEAVRPRSVTRH